MIMLFTYIHIYDNNKDINIYITHIHILHIYKKSLKKCLRLFYKTFSNFQATSKSDNFSQSERGLTPPLPNSCFHLLFKDPVPLHNKTRVSTGFENMGGAPMGGGALQNLIGGS